MKIEHIAIWTRQLEELKDFYCKYFGGASNAKYRNEKKQFESYFVSFGNGARLEIMSRPDIPANENDTIDTQHLGLIHFAFEVDTMKEVDEIAKHFEDEGLPILSGPRKTGDGYYEFETLDPDGNRLEVTTKYVD
ncbi:MAG: VOC family protein [Cyclobacteriaceae bacterium]